MKDGTNNQQENLDFQSLIGDMVKDPFPNLEKLDKLETKQRAIQFPRLFLLKFQSDKNCLIFKDIEIKEYSSDFNQKILQCDAKGGAYISPTIKYSPVKPDKDKKDMSISDRIKKGIEKALTGLEKYLSANFKGSSNVGGQLLKEFKEKKNDILNKLYEKQVSLFDPSKDFPTNFNSILSVLINDKYVSEIQEFLNVIEIKTLETRFKFEDQPGEARQCSLCHETSQFVSGNVSPFSFYTVDKMGYNVGGFNPEKAVDNFPVCKNCAISMEIGKRILLKKFSMQIGGVNCLLIPRNLGSIESLRDFIDYYEKQTQSLENVQEMKMISNREQRILKILGNYQDAVTINFLFYEESGPGNSVFSILMHIQDILPSRIKRIVDAIEITNKFDPNPPFKGLNTDTYNMNFSFKNLRDLFYRENNAKINQKAFLEVLWNLFVENQMDFRDFIKRFFVRLNGKMFNDRKSNDSPLVSLNKEIVKFLPIIYLFQTLNQLKF